MQCDSGSTAGTRNASYLHVLTGRQRSSRLCKLPCEGLARDALAGLDAVFLAWRNWQKSLLALAAGATALLALAFMLNLM
jgi:hypothetical protein